MPRTRGAFIPCYFLAYRELCRQPWRDVATVLYGTGMRPGEAYKLRWEHVLLNGKGGLIQIAEGKTKAARRFLPMVPEVYAALKRRRIEQNDPATGWVFPAGSMSGHLEECSARLYHNEAQQRLLWHRRPTKRGRRTAARAIGWTRRRKQASWTLYTSGHTAQRFRRAASGLRFTAFATLP